MCNPVYSSNLFVKVSHLLVKKHKIFVIYTKLFNLQNMVRVRISGPRIAIRDSFWIFRIPLLLRNSCFKYSSTRYLSIVDNYSVRIAAECNKKYLRYFFLCGLKLRPASVKNFFFALKILERNQFDNLIIIAVNISGYRYWEFTYLWYTALDVT